MRTFLSIFIGLLLTAIAVIIGCSKTTILNEVEESGVYSKPQRSLPRDTTERDTLHEITFSPRVIGWEVIDGEDTIRVEL